MKRLLRIIVAIMLVAVSVFSLIACSEDSGETSKKGITYTTNKDGNYVVRKYVAEEGVTELDIESAVILDSGDLDAVVVEIKEGAFKNVDSLEKIIVPSTVTKIGHGAFEGVKNLKELVLPFVGGNVLADAYPNQTAGSPDKATDEARMFSYIFGHDEYDGGAQVSIYDAVNQTASTFYMPMTLEKIVINPLENYEIPMYAFNGLTFELDIELSEKVVGIGESAFASYTKLYNLTLPSSIATIYKNAFNGCSALTQITFDGTAAEWAEVTVLQDAFENLLDTFKVVDKNGAKIELA